MTPGLRAEFWSRVERGTDCWEWTRQRDRYGYGRFWLEGKHRKAHRVAWELTRGPIPAGLYVCHSCDNPSCVRPLHLHLGTNADNQREAVARGRNYHARKTHCKHGHPFDEANTYWPRAGKRDCRACIRERRRRCDERKAAA